MSRLLSRLVLSSLLLWASAARCDVRDTETHRQLSLGPSTPLLALPREDWVLAIERVRKDRAVVYYMLSSEQRGASFSVYINSQPQSQEASELLAASLKNPAYKAAKDMERGESGPFRLAYFTTEAVAPNASVQSHIQASALVGGHWFDVHVSKSARDKVDKQVLLEVLQTLVLRQSP
jgi:hypothetical protein